MLKTCIDTNVWISGILFGGPPAAIVTAALNQRFEVIASRVILDEIERNLLGKFGFGKTNTKRFINRFLQVVDLYEPKGSVKIIPAQHPDNLILETAMIGRARYLVTGDREHLLPLKNYRMIRIIEPAHFLNLLKSR
jgi:putative PIN family toxin of toxin-antitoxin system